MPNYVNLRPGLGLAGAFSRHSKMQDHAPKIDNAPVCPISNLPRLARLSSRIPNKYEFEIWRLRRENLSLTYDCRRANGKIARALLVLHDELRFWRVGLYEKQWETYSQIIVRMRHLEATIRCLEDVQPTGEIPQLKPRWR